MYRNVTIINKCSYPIRVPVGLDLETGLEKMRAIKSLGRIGPIEVDDYTYDLLRLNPSITLVEVLS